MAGNRLINAREIKRQVELSGPAKTQQFLAELLEQKKVRPDDFSIRELAEGFMGREWVDNLNPKSGRFYEPAELMEANGAAVAYHQFSNITGQIFFTAVQESYGLEDLPFSKIIPTKPSQIQDMEKVAGISEVGDEFTVVGEGELYPDFGVSEDYVEVAAKQKRGGVVKVTKEAVFGDLTGKLLERCKGIGSYLAVNKEKRLIDCVIDENGGAVSAAIGGHRYHWKGTTYATYQTTTPWDNVTASAALVDWTDINEAWQTLIGITDPYTGEPIPQKPKHLVVTPQNLMTAYRILTATNTQLHAGGYAVTGNLNDTHAPSPLDKVVPGLQIVYSQLLAARAATDTDWWFGDLAKAFAYFENWGITPEEAPPNSKEAFDRDVIHMFKVSEKGCACTLNPRYVTECRA